MLVGFGARCDGIPRGGANSSALLSRANGAVFTADWRHWQLERPNLHVALLVVVQFATETSETLNANFVPR